jgi:hypothetical protein
MICLLAWACDDAENSVYRGYSCYFIFDTSLHPIPCQLTMSLGNTGQFMMIKTTMSGGIRHLQTTRNYDQATEDIPLTTKRETETRCQLGANNSIIIGRSSYTGIFVCYEGQCSNCLEEFGGKNYPLTWSTNGQQLSCARCHRSYDVNNGVVATGEGGRQLFTYNVAFDGAILRAWN